MLYGADSLAAMIDVAANEHRNQFDKGGNPYILHPLAVMHMNPNFDWDQKCIAVGHDLIEDTRITALILENMGFNCRVVDGIVALTKVQGESYETYKNKVKSNPDAIKVKMCDLIHNSDIRRLKGLTQKDFDRIQRYHVFYSELKILDTK